MEMERRLARLEQQLGLTNASDNNNYHSGSSRIEANKAGGKGMGEDWTTRVTKLEQRQNQLFAPPTGNNSTNSSSGGGEAFLLSFREWEELLNSLSPGTALTHQQQIVAPILYRRAELLAAAAPFATDLAQLEQIGQLLLVGASNLNNNHPRQQVRAKTTTTTTTTSANITEEQVLQAHILTASSPTVVQEERQRLDAMAKTALELQSRIQNASNQLDRMVDNYSILVAAISEKLVLAAEGIQNMSVAKP